MDETTGDRRATARARLIACAERAIAAGGLASLRARSLADCAGCSVGAIYNLVADIDELVLRVGQRTMAALGARLDVVSSDRHGPDVLVEWALAYCAFAAENRNLWRALFEFRMTPGHPSPAWFEADQMQLFERLENELGARLPRLGMETRRLHARTLFSAVHGIVALGLEEKLVAMPVDALERELAAFVRTYLSGAGG